MPQSDEAPTAEGLVITPHVSIPYSEIELTAITGSGPGGQNVNRSATRIALRWNVRNTSALDDAQRTRALGVLDSRLDGEGNIRIVAGEHRSQLQNRVEAFARLTQLLARALVVQKKRRATKPTRGSIEKRLTEKKQRSSTKKDRGSRGRHHDD
ncbi:MAG: alternative ribosome rescue aminoacyl-tRNA hydrolase ArfB [Gemmatimonadaceae bacterium]